jgi:hypothetical protein
MVFWPQLVLYLSQAGNNHFHIRLLENGREECRTMVVTLLDFEVISHNHPPSGNLLAFILKR